MLKRVLRPLALSSAAIARPTTRAAYCAPRALSARFASSTSTSSSGLGVDNLGSYDNGMEIERVSHKPGDADKRNFTYLMAGGARLLYASAVRLAVLRFVASLSASADVLALASLEVPLAAIDEGSTVTVKWRGKPVFIRHRTPTEITAAEEVAVDTLRDPETDAQRRKADNPDWLIVLGVCTHLGCVPLPGQGEYKGWYCPCHGSHYDTAGRIRKGPAPLNLEVPQWKFVDDGAKVLIG